VSAGRSFAAALRVERLGGVISAACGMEEVSGSVDVRHAQRGAISVRNARVPARARVFSSFPARSGRRLDNTRSACTRE